MESSLRKHIVVYVTAPEEKAKDLARALVESRLAACVNILSGARSIYYWQGKVCDEEEALLVIKTRSGLLEELTKTILTLHPYEVPEVIAVPIVGGSPSYLKWLDESTLPF
jgi:periplasmic divalent cation tolerance protein